MDLADRIWSEFTAFIFSSLLLSCVNGSGCMEAWMHFIKLCFAVMKPMAFELTAKCGFITLRII